MVKLSRGSKPKLLVNIRSVNLMLIRIFRMGLSLKLETCMSRLLVLVVFVSCFVGCYPQPEVEPVRPTVEHIQEMQQATLPDGTPLFPENVKRRGLGAKYGSDQ